jgi:hypothetical protein
MLRLIVIVCLLIAPAAHAARPKLIHQSQTLPKPAGYYYFGYEIAVDGDWALIAAATPSPPQGQTQRHDALLYHFVNGQWTFDRVLVSRFQIEGETLAYFRSFAMNNGLAAIGSNPTQVFKRTDNTWTEISHPFTAPTGDSDHVVGTLQWDGNTLLAEKSSCSDAQPWGARISTLLADGSWTPLQRITGFDNCVLRPTAWDISGDTVVTGTFSDDPEAESAQVRVFRRGGTTWQLTSSVSGTGGEADVRGNEFYFGADLPGGGTGVYRNDDTLTLLDRLRTVSEVYGVNTGTSRLTYNSDVLLRHRDVFRKNDAGKYGHVARLVTRGDLTLTDEPEISGRRVLSSAVRRNDSSYPVVTYHQLPATYTPSPVIATAFTNGTAPFTPVIGSFAVATTPTGNRVYRQTSVNGEYRALLNNSDWQEQSIEADINPTTLGDWAGLAVRHLDDANYYYVAVRSSGRIALEMMRNGERTRLREVQLPRTGTNWHVALQVLNRGLRVLVDGQEVIWYFDQTPILHGSAALVGNATAVDYDNVVVAQVGQSPIFDLQYGWCHGSLEYTRFYTITGSGSWSCDYDPNGSDTDIMQQTATTDIARVVIGGGPTDDQVIDARARLTAVNGSDRWLGIIARYVNESNYYYVTLRGSNTVSLRKVVNGVVTVLGTANLPVTLNTWYDLRLDAVGNELRAFVNNRQVLQATDASHPIGRTGMLTYKAGAEFSNFIVWQP